jgi:hypothetical protein
MGWLLPQAAAFRQEEGRALHFFERWDALLTLTLCLRPPPLAS